MDIPGLEPEGGEEQGDEIGVGDEPSVVAAAQSGNLSVGGVVSQVIAGGAGGAILTAIIGAIKNKAMA